MYYAETKHREVKIRKLPSLIRFISNDKIENAYYSREKYFFTLDIY